MNNHKNNSDHTLAKGLGIAVFMALGAAIGMIFAPKEGTETQKDIVEKAQKLAKKFNRSRADLQKTVQSIFGEVSEELEKNYLELQGDILAHIDHLHAKAELTQKKYDEVLDEKVTKFSQEKKWSEKVLKNLKQSFVDAWEEVKKQYS